MKSNVLQISSGEAFNAGVLEEAEKCAVYNNLDTKASLRLTLLAEELVGTIPNLAEGFTGKFWIENEGGTFELHAVIKCNRVDYDIQDKFLSVSKSGKNAAAKGVVGKIRTAVALMMADTDPTLQLESFYRMEDGLYTTTSFTYAWSLENYMEKVRSKVDSEEWDEYEKSLIANLADDVVVGVVGREVSIVVKKKF